MQEAWWRRRPSWPASKSPFPLWAIGDGDLTGTGRSRRQLLAALRAYQSLSRVDWLSNRPICKARKNCISCASQPQVSAASSCGCNTAMLMPEPGLEPLTVKCRRYRLQNWHCFPAVFPAWPILSGTSRRTARTGPGSSACLMASNLPGGRQWTRIWCY